jgi:hypothetical protein
MGGTARGRHHYALTLTKGGKRSRHLDRRRRLNVVNECEHVSDDQSGPVPGGSRLDPGDLSSNSCPAPKRETK